MVSRNEKIIIRMDANHSVGLAHAVRLSSILAHVKTPLEIHVLGEGDHRAVFFDQDVILHDFDASVQSEEEKATATVELAKKIAAQGIMVDQPHQTAACWRVFENSPFSIIAIDDMGGPVQADIIFNGTVLDEYHHYAQMPEGRPIYCGAEYVLINPCFAQNKWHRPQDNSLISIIGSGDTACEWALFLTQDNGPLARLRPLAMTMIIGSSYPKYEQLWQNCQKLGIKLMQGISQQKMAKLMSIHSLALITGGMIVYEALAVGIPAIVYPQEDNLPPEAKYFAQKGCIIDLEKHGGFNDTAVYKNLIKLLQGKNREFDLSGKARNSIDGQGIIRTAVLLDEFLYDLIGDKNK